MTKYYVEWKTEGYEYMANKRNGPYNDSVEAEEHRRDIAGYEGVFDCEIVEEEVRCSGCDQDYDFCECPE